MYSPYDIIKTLIHSEKGARLENDGCYQFLVAKNSTKVDIRRAVEKIYKVKVTDVNTVITHGKMKRVRTQLGKQPDWKKAYVKLAKGHKIEVK
ncbi:MAG: 50S ribosomal protein L23 [Candidatus Omnitrophica bacterium]|nr:50S ribosomal protein L23 [Candidatus Omnitrophota bacterium]